VVWVNAYSLPSVPRICISVLLQSLTGKSDEGVRAIETYVQLEGRRPLGLGILGGAYSIAGRIREAQILLKELEGLAQEIYLPSMAFAMAYLGLREIDKALDWFDKAAEERNATIVHFHYNPIWDSLRSHPRYHALLRKINRDRFQVPFFSLATLTGTRSLWSLSMYRVLRLWHSSHND